MNRRSFLIALAVAAPVAAIVPLKIAASWRPVKVALIDPPNPSGPRLLGPTISFVTYASAREIIFPTGQENKLFDLQTGQVRGLGSSREGIVAGGNGHWRFKSGETPQLIVRQNAIAERSYGLPAADVAELNAMPEALYQEWAIIAANEERVEMVIGAHYYRWNAGTRALERSTNCEVQTDLENQALTRDGQILINANMSEISARSTQTGAFTRHDKLPRMNAQSAYISAFGGFAVYEPNSIASAQTRNWSVLDAATASDIWTFTLDSYQKDVVLFGPDEKTVVIGRGDRKVWELCDIETGKIARTLPMVVGATSAVFSPDGATLYSVSGGVLYRQRAR